MVLGIVVPVRKRGTPENSGRVLEHPTSCFEGDRSMPNKTMDAKERIDTPVEIFLDNYTYIGEDSEGYHHHVDKHNTRIIVCDDDGERVGERGWYLRLDPDDVDHVEYGLQWAPELERWADYVEVKRGWESRELKTYPELTQALDDAFRTGGTC